MHDLRKVKYRKMAILTRTNKNAREFEQYMIFNSIPYDLHTAVKFLSRKEIKLSFNYMLLLKRPDDQVAFEYILETREGFGDKMLEKLSKHARDNK